MKNNTKQFLEQSKTTPSEAQPWWSWVCKKKNTKKIVRNLGHQIIKNDFLKKMLKENKGKKSKTDHLKLNNLTILFNFI